MPASIEREVVVEDHAFAFDSNDGHGFAAERLDERGELRRRRAGGARGKALT
jgi:hypothetical protein